MRRYKQWFIDETASTSIMSMVNPWYNIQQLPLTERKQINLTMTLGIYFGKIAIVDSIYRHSLRVVTHTSGLLINAIVSVSIKWDMEKAGDHYISVRKPELRRKLH